MAKSQNIKYLVLWVTRNCNLMCKYCYAKENFKKENMNYDIAKKAIDLLDENSTLVIAGGEPLLNFDLVKKICDYIKYKNLKVKISMQTNATLIDEDIAKQIKKYGIGIGVSIDGMPKINELTRGKTKDTLRGISILKDSNIPIYINSVVSNLNIDKLDTLSELCLYFENIKGIGLDLLRQTPDKNVEKPDLNKIKESLINLYDKTKDIERLTGRKIFIREIEDCQKRLDNNYFSCNYCYASKAQSAVVIPKGDMYMCSSLVGNKNYYLGNIDEGFTLKNLENPIYDECRTCKYFKHCKKICPSRAIMNKVGNIISKEDCILRKACFYIIENRRGN